MTVTPRYDTIVLYVTIKENGSFALTTTATVNGITQKAQTSMLPGSAVKDALDLVSQLGHRLYHQVGELATEVEGF